VARPSAGGQSTRPGARFRVSWGKVGSQTVERALRAERARTERTTLEDRIGEERAARQTAELARGEGRPALKAPGSSLPALRKTSTRLSGGLKPPRKPRHRDQDPRGGRHTRHMASCQQADRR
jgi:hypothetical protein